MNVHQKIDKLIEEAEVASFEANQEKEREDSYHKYSDNSREELQLLLKHHQEDLQEYIDRGDDQEDIDHIKEDIREIEIELKRLK